MDSEIKISVLVPVYGVEAYIERCATSLFNQTYDNIEYIFVNDCTRDRSIEILQKVIEKYPDREPNIKILHHAVNQGLAQARNTGIRSATGDYITFVDSDDEITHEAIDTLVKKTENREVDIVVFGMKYRYEDKIVSTNIGNYNFTSKEDYINAILSRKVPVNVWGKLYKRSLFEESGLRFVKGLDYGEDYVTLPRIVYYSKKISYCNNLQLYIYNRTNDTSYMGRGLTHKAQLSVQRAVNILVDFFEDKQIRSQEFNNNIKLYNKIYLLKYSERKEREEINENLWLDLNNIKGLSWIDNIIWTFSQKHQYRLLDTFLKIGFLYTNIKTIIKAKVSL